MTFSRLRVAVWMGLLIAIPISAQTGAQGAQGEGRPSASPDAASLIAAGDVEHGRYLAEHVAMCVECHSRRDGQGNIIPGERYLGGAIPPGPPWAGDWAIRAPRNRGLPGYTDEQAMRLLTQGAINREGRQLQPPMPRFRMRPRDAADVIAYLRSLR